MYVFCMSSVRDLVLSYPELLQSELGGEELLKLLQSELGEEEELLEKEDKRV